MKCGYLLCCQKKTKVHTNKGIKGIHTTVMQTISTKSDNDWFVNSSIYRKNIICVAINIQFFTTQKEFIYMRFERNIRFQAYYLLCWKLFYTRSEFREISQVAYNGRYINSLLYMYKTLTWPHPSYHLPSFMSHKWPQKITIHNLESCTSRK